MMTKSPMSMWGANVGLCLPRSIAAAWLARRPSTTSVASMTIQLCWTSAALGEYVRVIDASLIEWMVVNPTPRCSGSDAAGTIRWRAHSGAHRLCAPRIEHTRPIAWRSTSAVDRRVVLLVLRVPDHVDDLLARGRR